MKSRSMILVLLVCAAGCSGGSQEPSDSGDSEQDCKRNLTALGSTSLSLQPGEQIALRIALNDSCTGPVQDETVEFGFIGTGLDAHLSADQSQTDTAGQAGVTLTAGDTAGALTVAASYTPASAEVRFAIEVSDPCSGHCQNGQQDCGEAGVDCGGEDCSACANPCENHCSSGVMDCGEVGVDCGGAGCGWCEGNDDAAVEGHTLPAQMNADATVWATVTMRNTGDLTWYRDGVEGYKLGYVGDDGNPFVPGPGQGRVMLAEGQTVLPGASATFQVSLRAPATPGTYMAEFQMLLDGKHWFGAIASQGITIGQGPGGCRFPQGVPEEDFIGSGADRDPAIEADVNAVMATLSGCNPGSDCYIGDQHPDGQSWFGAVSQALRDMGYCAGQHEEGYTDEIAVSSTGCIGRWYGYHIYNYGGLKVVWCPGAARGWWSIDPQWCD